MVQKLFERIAVPMRTLTRPVRGLHQAAYVLAALTLASQALALLRDRTFAHAFGAGPTLDLYYAAFRVPDLVFALVASLVSAYVLIPRLANLDQEKSRRLISESTSFLVIFGGGICLVLAVFMPQFLALLYPNLVTLPHQAAFVFLARLLLVQPILLGLSGVLASVTQLHRRFFLFALSPVLYNLGIIFGVMVLYPFYGLPGIGFGVALGALAHVAVNIPIVVGAGVFPRPTWPTMARMIPIMRASVPRSLALTMGSITLLALTSLASRLGSGAVSVFTFAGNLEAVPLALIGSSYAVAAFPALSEASGKEHRQEFTRILSASSRHILLWSLLFLGLIAVLRAHIVRVILGTGAFGWDATRLTAALLAVLAVGLVAQGLVLLFARALYATDQAWRPLFYQVIGATLTVGLGIVFLAFPHAGITEYVAHILRVSAVPGNAVLLIAVAATVGQLFLATVYLLALTRLAPGLARSLLRPVLQGSVATFAAGSAAYAVLAVEGGIVPLTTLASVLSQGVIAGTVGIVVAGLVLHLLHNAEFQDVTRAVLRLVRARGARTEVLAPSSGDTTPLH